MHYWLLKSEPNTYSWDDFVKENETEWDGVRNYLARNTMRAMQVGDQFFFYHSVGEKSIVGIGEVSALAHPDSTDKTGIWECVDVQPVRALARPIELVEIKADEKLREMKLVTHSRLSVQPVTPTEWKQVLQKESQKHS